MGSFSEPGAAATPATPRRYTVRRATPADRERVLAFYERHFPQHKRLTTGRYWEWQFLDQPTDDGEVPFFLLEDGGDVHGGIGYIARRAVIDGQVVRARVPICFFVSEPYRGLPSLMLLRAVMADADVLLASSFSEEAYRLVIKAGFRDFGGSLKHYWCATHFQAHGVAAALRYWVKVLLRLTRRLRTSITSPSLTYRAERDLLPDMSSACEGHPADQQFIKNQAWVSWRYSKSPLLDVQYVHQYSAGEPVGLAVVSRSADGHTCEVLDLWWRNENTLRLAALLDEVRRVAGQSGCDAVATHAVGGRLDRAFGKSLFSATASPLGFLLMSRRKDIAERAMQVRNWSLLIGDTDAA
jgi:hypothetical protein